MNFFSHIDTVEILFATSDTLIMLVVSLALTVLLGLPLGVWLWLTGPSGLQPKPLVYGVVGLVVNVLRSIPFVILFILLIPVTLALVGP